MAIQDLTEQARRIKGQAVLDVITALDHPIIDGEEAADYFNAIDAIMRLARQAKTDLLLQAMSVLTEQHERSVASLHYDF